MRRIWGEIPLWTRNASTPGPLTIRQWPVQARGIRICRTFLHWHSGTFKKLMAIMQAMQELHCHARLARDSCMAIGFLTCAMCKKVWHKSYTSGQCPLTRRKFNSRTQCCQGQCKVLCQNDTLFQVISKILYAIITVLLIAEALQNTKFILPHFGVISTWDGFHTVGLCFTVSFGGRNTWILFGQQNIHLKIQLLAEKDNWA